jgi:hypothetical protein
VKLGIKKSSACSSNINNKDSDKSESPSSQQLEDLSDDIKQSFIRDYKMYDSQ